MRRYFLVVLVGLVVLVAGCSDGDAEVLEPPAEDVVLRVVTGETIARDWTLDELEAEVAFTEVVIEGDLQAGPLFLDAIDASGVAEWETAEVLGMSEGRVLEVALDVAAADVDETWILDVSNRGTLKLAAPDLPRERWVRDVGEIRFP